MSRVIKFRAWDKWAKEMIYDFGATRNNYTLILGVDDKDNLELRWEGANEQPLPLMQFTGLLDKNGKEIYEGDMLRCIQYGIDVDFQMDYDKICDDLNCEVYWDNEHGSWALRAEGVKETYPLCYYDTLEVIGNVYTKPFKKVTY